MPGARLFQVLAADTNLMAEIITCSECQRKLQVPESYLGQKVQCPECGHQFLARSPSDAVQPTPRPSSVPPPDDTRDDDPPRRRRFEPDDDEYDDIGRIRQSGVPHRGGMILALGIIAWVLFPLTTPICGPIAWSMGNSDLANMRAGQMDRSGEGMVQAGRILGMVGTIAVLVIFVPFCLLCGLGMVAG